MVSKSTSILMAVAIVAVAAVAIIGIGYAYTASTDNTSNTSSVTYMTLSQGSYTGSFNGGVVYNTVTTASGTTKTFDSSQITAIGETGLSGICLGTANLTVAQTGTVSDYKFSVSNTGTMTGTFYIGIQVGGGAEVVRSYTANATNFYSTADGTGAITAIGSAATIDDEVTSIVVKMYVNAMPEPAANAEVVKPLNGVTFQFTITATA